MASSFLDDGIKFGCGYVLTFSDVWCIISGRKRDTDDDSEDEAEENGISLVDD